MAIAPRTWSGMELPALATAGRWKNSRMPARYTERRARRPGRGGEVLPGGRGLILGLMLLKAADSAGSSPSRWANLDGRQNRL